MTVHADFAIFSFNSFLAAMLALWIGFSLGLPRPYWAMLTVYITAQPLTGALRSKALFRVLGTVLGAAAAVVLVPALVDAPPLLTLALAAWAGGCLYLSLLDRTPRAYVFMLAGYTAAIIGFPSVAAPGAVFETAVARVEEITLGILCATLTHTVIFPRDVAATLNAQVARHLADARRWICGALQGGHGEIEERERASLAAALTELRTLAAHLAFDTSNRRPRARAVRALQDRLAILPPLLSGVEDRLAGLREADALPAAIATLASDVAAWAREAAPPRQAALDLQARCEAPPQEPALDWSTLLVASATTRLSELVGALQEARDLAAYLADPPRGDPAHLEAALRGRARRPLHRDHALAALSAVALMAAVAAACAFWIATAWPAGAVAALSATVFASFFAAQDDPSPAIVSFMGWTLASVPVAAIYLFAVLPAIDGFPLLVAALAPAFLLFGYLQADPRHSGRAIALILGVAGALSLQGVFSADFPQFLDASLAQVVGIGAALVATRLVRSVNAGFSARRLLRRGWRDLARLAMAHPAPSREVWTSAMLDRLGLLAPRLAVADPYPELQAADPWVDHRVGLNLIDLKAARRALGPDGATWGGGAAEAALAGVARLYGARAAGRPPPDAAAVLAAVDAAVREVGSAAPSPARRRGLVALAGLRRTLFPRAAAFTPQPSRLEAPA